MEKKLFPRTGNRNPAVQLVDRRYSDGAIENRSSTLVMNGAHLYNVLRMQLYTWMLFEFGIVCKKII
jgi:hypothetical protein